MFSNYLKIAWRNIWKSRQVSAVNIIGMAVAISAALLLCMTVYRELSYNEFHVNRNNLYEVYKEEYHAERTEGQTNMPFPLAAAMKAEIPGIKAVTRFNNGAASLKAGDVIQSIGLRYVDSSFLNIFTFPAVAGDSRLGLNEVFLTEKSAAIYFKGQDPIGKTISLRDGNTWVSYTVGAVLKNPPDNSSIRFDALVRLENHPDYNRDRENWGNFSLETFVMLNPGVTIADIENRGKVFLEKHYADDIDRMKKAGARNGKYGGVQHLGLTPIMDVHFSKHSSLADMKKPLLYMLLVIAGFLLFIASINFVNLTLARSFTRAKEVGMRKMLGAARFQLVAQLCGEALVLFLFSLALGLLLTWALLPSYSALFSSSFVYSYGIIFQPKFLAGILGVMFIITLLAGGYPALLLARTQTLLVLKGKVSTGRKNYFRNSLIVVQFVFACLLICSTIIAWQQMNYLKHKPLGFNSHTVVSIPVGYETNGRQILERMKTLLVQQPDIVSVSGAGFNFGRGKDGSASTSIITFDIDGRDIKSHWQSIDYDYVKTMDLQLVAGSDFNPVMGTDSFGLVINEKMAKQLGVKDVATFRFRMDEDGPEYHINGIVKDYHFKSLRDEIESLTMYLNTPEDPPGYIFVKTRPENLAASFHIIEEAWKKAAPGVQFQGSFLDENTQRQYKAETTLTRIFISGAVLTIIISCMGLFAMAMLVIGRRTKEIGIRKVLGASAAGIAGLIAKDFLLLVVLAILISTPIAWFIMGKWLEGYAYRTQISWWVFGLGGMTAILIAAFTVSFQSIKAALMNPVKSLRSE